MRSQPLTDPALINNQKVTYKYDCIRGTFQGLLDAGWMTLVLLIAIRVYKADTFIKSLIAGSGFAGYFITPLTLSLCSRTGFRASTLAGLYLMIGAGWLFIAGFMSQLVTYTCLIVVWRLWAAQVAPFMVQIYANNYLSKSQGQKLSTGLMLAALSGTIFAYVSGKALNHDGAYAHSILWSMAFASFVCGILVYKMPSSKIQFHNVGSWVKNLSWIWRDQTFGQLLLAWSMSSFAHWMLVPMRMEYMVESQYGLNATNEQVALMTFAIPALGQILSTRIWGVIFDRMHFIKVRLLVNLFYIAGFLIFFYTKHMYLLGFGSFLVGVAGGGAVLTWGIWTAKMTDPETAPAYMSAQASVSGLRGFFSPFIAYLILGQASIHRVAWTSTSLIILSSLLFLNIQKKFRSLK